MTVSSPAKSLKVAVIAESPETIDGLDEYLRRVGVTSHATRSLRDAVKVSSTAVAVVLFPDEFKSSEALNQISLLRASRPRLLIIVVTNVPQRLHPALEPDGRSLLPVVLPKPAFGWSILDAIRAHAHAESP